MTKIEKKVWPKYFEAILREWDPEKKDYTGRTLEKQVTYYWL